MRIPEQTPIVLVINTDKAPEEVNFNFPEKVEERVAQIVPIDLNSDATLEEVKGQTLDYLVLVHPRVVRACGCCCVLIENRKHILAHNEKNREKR